MEFKLQHHSLQRNPRVDFRMDWLDLLAVQWTLKSLLQHHSSKASILRCSACFIVQLSHFYMTAGKTIALTTRTFASKVMSLLFNMLSRIDMGFPGGSDGKESACDEVQSLGWKDPLEEAWQSTPVFLPGESPWTEKPSGLQSMRSQRIRHN